GGDERTRHTVTRHDRHVSPRRRDPRHGDADRGRRVLRAGVSWRAGADSARLVGVQIRARRDVLHASQVRQPLLHVPVRRTAAARDGRHRRPALHLLRDGAATNRNVSAWNSWDLHPTVIIGLVLLGGLYVYLGGLRSPRRRIAGFTAALLVLFFALNGPLHNL